MIILPKPLLRSDSFEEVLLRRRSARSFAAQPLKASQLGQLLFATGGVTGRAFDRPLRSVPSAGGLFPVEIYVASQRVDEVRPGVYHYRPEPHGLELVVPGDVGEELADIGLGQRLFREAAAVIVLTAVPGRTRDKYRHLSERFVHMEVGHAAQNTLLQAAALRIAAVPVGVFKEPELCQLLELSPGKETPLYLIAVGAEKEPQR